MAKSKEQKRQEADWRKIRGKMVEMFRAGSDERVLSEYGPWFVEQREQIWAQYLSLPLQWRKISMEGWVIPQTLIDRLDMEAIEQQARELEQATPQLSATRPRRRI